MKLTPRTQWPDTYLRGSHCFSTMINNAFTGTEFVLDEELAYVIGGGLGLLFHRDGQNYYINSRIHDLEHFFARRTGARIEFLSHATAGAMLARAREWADAGTLPYLYCEARELSSFRGVLPWNAVHAFGEHALPVRSISADGSSFVNDYLWAHPLELSAEEVAVATAMPSDGAISMACPARRFAVGRIIPPADVPDLREVLALSLVESAELFLNPANNTQGERALKALERALTSMPDVLDAPAMRVELLSMATTLEKIGSGGGAGRHLFARGLHAASTHVNNSHLTAVASEYAALGGRWRVLAHTMHARAAQRDPRDEWAGLIAAIREIRRREVAAVTELLSVSTAVLGAAA